MSRPFFRAVALGLLLAGLSAGVVANDEASTPEAAAMRTREAALAAELRASAEPRDWALAADIFGGDGTFPADRAELLAKAAAAAPDDAFVQWLALANLKQPDAANSEPAERARRLVASDPGNAAVWLPSLALAVETGDAARIDEVLGRMAAAERFDEHFRDYLVAWLDVFARGVRGSPESETDAFILAMARAAAITLPGYANVTQACDPAKSAGHVDARADACERLARLMMDGNIFITQIIGYVVLRKIDRATPDDTERERVLRWLTRSAAQFDASVAVDDAHRMAADWREAGSEAEVFRRRALRAGFPLTPPPDWDWREPKP